MILIRHLTSSVLILVSVFVVLLGGCRPRCAWSRTPRAEIITTADTTLVLVDSKQMTNLFGREWSGSAFVFRCDSAVTPEGPGVVSGPLTPTNAPPIIRISGSDWTNVMCELVDLGKNRRALLEVDAKNHVVRFSAKAESVDPKALQVIPKALLR